MTSLVLLLGLTLAQATPSSKKVEIVSATGCLKEASPNTWTLVDATEPVASSANAPAAKDAPPSPPPPGKNSFRLIGVSEFNLPAHRDHAVTIKGLLIKGTPVNRLNMTSVTTIAPACATAGK